MSAYLKPRRSVAARWGLLRVSANSIKRHPSVEWSVPKERNYILRSEQGMSAANSGANLCCSTQTPAEILDKEQIKCDLAAQALKSSCTLRLRAFGFSMLPNLWPGDVLTIRSQNCAQCSVGDIVLYRRAGYFFIHRVVTKSESRDSLRVKGDWLPQSDPPVHAQQVLGKVVAVDRGGLHFQPPPASTSAPIVARVLWSCGFLLRIAMAIYARWPGRRSMSPKQDWSFIEWA